MAQQDIRYYLNGLLMITEDGLLKLVATDGHPVPDEDPAFLRRVKDRRQEQEKHTQRQSPTDHEAVSGCSPSVARTFMR